MNKHTANWLAAVMLCTAMAEAAAQAPAVVPPSDVPQDVSQKKAQEPSPTPVATTTRFDGDWTVRIDCPANTESSGAKGYSYDFPASVLNGKLFGSHGQQGAEGSMQLEGAIGNDGEAHLQARGRTASPEYAVNKPPSGTVYSYDVQAHFEPSSGSGTRVQARACNFSFSRR